MTSKTTSKSNAKILTANDLLSGLSVFYTRDGAWTSSLSEALVARDPEAEASLDAAGKAAVAANKVVGAYFVEVSQAADGAPEPVHYRERLRASAQPSFWRARRPAKSGPSFESRSREEQYVSV